MRLMHGKLSPFVRKVMIAAIEKGIDGQIELVPTAVGAGKTNLDLMQLNPAGKIPTLVLDNGTSVFDSLVICDYFDQLKPEPRLIPQDPARRLRALSMNAIADGLLTAGVLAKGEASRPTERQWPEFLAAQTAKMRKSFEALNAAAPDANVLTVGEIAAACALGWADLRAPEEPWRTSYPALAAWFDQVSTRPSLMRTKPQT
jgi:glutathione S-transferase